MARVDVAIAPHFPRSNQYVAVKRIREDLVHDPTVKPLFDAERYAGQLVQHPNIVACLDAGEEDGSPYLVLELVDGLSLRQIQTLRPYFEPSPRAVLELGSQIASALECIHGATDGAGRDLEFVHRDVSPNNILVDWSGIAKLTDFGISLFRGRPRLTARGAVRGKPGFMAPELIEGRVATAASDVFALGLVLGEFVSGLRILPRLLLRAKDLSTLMAEALSGVLTSDELRALLVEMVDRDPAKRPSAGEVRSRLGELIEATSPASPGLCAMMDRLSRCVPSAAT